RTPCFLVLHSRPAVRANGIVKVVVHLAASPGHLKLLFANPAGVDREFGVANVVEHDAVFESVSNVPDEFPAVFLVIAGTQHHRKLALAAGDHLKRAIIGQPYVDAIEAIQVDEFTAFRQHPHDYLPPYIAEGLPHCCCGGHGNLSPQWPRIPARCSFWSRTNEANWACIHASVRRSYKSSSAM